MARTTPQELKTGTLWPQWAQGELFRLAALKHALHNGFIPSPVTTRKKDRKAETKSVGCETAPGCPFQLVIARSKTSHSHQFYTEQSNLDHNHALWSWDGLEQAKAEQGRLQEEVKKTVAALKAKAQDELKNLRKSADVFACSTVPADPNELSPTSEQECTIQDVGDALGADIGRRFEQEMRELGLLADDYPSWSTFDGTAHPTEMPPWRRAPAGATLPAADISSPGEEGHAAYGLSRLRKSPASKNKWAATNPSSSAVDEEIADSASDKGVISKPPRPTPKKAKRVQPEPHASGDGPSGSVNKYGRQIIDFKGPSPFAPQIPQKREGGHSSGNSDSDGTIIATSSKRKREPAPSPMLSPLIKESPQLFPLHTDNADLDADDETRTSLSPSSESAPGPSTTVQPDPLAEYLQSLPSAFDFVDKYLIKLKNMDIDTPQQLQYAMSQERLAESIRKALSRGTGPIDIILQDFEQLLQQRRDEEASNSGKGEQVLGGGA
ncbi:hypothetical protein C6P46_005131 [Rhodotorula mucilaginosa]|uniref:Uncharacterized protein n=1 Tax=Rhodotorula mucilaginosa TaxID=5537 RepID=A0A9P6VYI6_RHOMI|nr:hypothetical protein C6P46_005131 [Rhodotorula mucilaginosa]